MLDTEFLDLFMRGPCGRLTAALWGAAWGSFFNVMICRLPAGESLVRPASHCRSCKAPVAWYDNVPILSFLLLRGRCRRCGARFSWGYWLVEVLVCLLALLMHHLFVAQGADPIGLRLARLVITSLFCGVLVAIAVIDLNTLRIPNAITYPAIPLCAGLSLLMGLPRWYDGLIGAVAGYGVIRLLADGYHLLTGREGMGYGDGKLLAMIGGLLGWQALLPTLFLSSLQGSVIGITALVVMRARQGPAADRPEDAAEEDAGAAGAGREDAGEDEAEEEDYQMSREALKENLRHARIPFGPYISLAAIEVLVLRDLLEQLLLVF